MANQTVREIMTPDPQCCTPEDTITTAARMMAAGNFGAVPVVDPESRRIVGIITDRDITCRITARGADPTRTPVREGMTQPVITVGPDTSIHECVRLMEQHQVRRIPVVDDLGMVLGIVAQADLARAAAREHELEHELAELVEEVSAPPHVLVAS